MAKGDWCLTPILISYYIIIFIVAITIGMNIIVIANSHSTPSPFSKPQGFWFWLIGFVHGVLIATIVHILREKFEEVDSDE